jgi:hypothetical protein
MDACWWMWKPTATCPVLEVVRVMFENDVVVVIIAKVELFFCLLFRCLGCEPLRQNGHQCHQLIDVFPPSRRMVMCFIFNYINFY